MFGLRRKSLGERAEAAAARFLKKQGMRVVTRNWRTRHGEVDLVMLDGPSLVFVEVKSRTSDSVAPPHATVTVAKQRRLTRLAEQFIQKTQQEHRPCRFDVVSVVWPADQRRPRVEHIVDAFPATGN